MTTRAHIVVILLTLVAVFFVLRLVHTRQLRSKYGLLWLVIAALMLAFAVFPRLLDELSEAIGVEYGPTTFMFLAVGFLFLVVVHYSWELSRMERRLRELAEELALVQYRVHEDRAGADPQDPDQAG